ncbi:MAG: hypothetical protein V1495_10800 [Pseudomonadota bacterium]
MKQLPAVFRHLLLSLTPLLLSSLIGCGSNTVNLVSPETLASDPSAITQCAPPALAALMGLTACGVGKPAVILNPNKPVGTAAANRDIGGTPFEKMKITWTYPAADRVGVNFEVKRKRDQASDFISLATNTANPMQFIDRGLAPGTTYTYKIVAVDANGPTESDLFFGTTLVAAGSPIAPAYLTGAFVASPLAIDLTWADQSGNETNFLIERSVDGLDFALLTPAPGLAANTVTYRDTTISYDHSYAYRVYAKNAAGRSPNSNQVDLAIGSEPAPAAPSGLQTTFVSTTQITLQFVDNSINENSFELQRKVGTGSFDAILTLSVQTGTGTVTVQDMSVSAGTSYTYRIKVIKGTLFAFSDELPVSTPAPPQKALAIAAGSLHTCALLMDGTVSCWGYGGVGQLGNGSFSDSSVPVAVTGLNNVISLTAGNHHTCARLSDNTMKCWGWNDFGQLGNGNALSQSVPVFVKVNGINNLTNVSAITAGYMHTCARLTDGTMKCWGSAADSQLGNGRTSGYSTVPVAVSGITTATDAITAHHVHTCARLADNKVKCWGSNMKGELGNNTITRSATPVSVSSISNASAVSAGDWNSCALLSTGSIQCWGWNLYGELGDSTTTDRLTPVGVNGITSASVLATGSNHSCAILQDGSLKCWGHNQYGQVGDSTTMDRLIPVAVNGISAASAIAMGAGHSCALLQGGSVQCWGLNSYGQLGSNDLVNRLTPTLVSGF